MKKKEKKKREKRKEKERGKETSILGEMREGQTQSIWFGEILLLLSIILHSICYSQPMERKRERI